MVDGAGLQGGAGGVPQVKICGLTSVEEALGCVELGAAAIGLVFYPPSTRNVSEEEARRICRELPASVTSVGVFVNESHASIMKKVDRCGLRAVQLHGREPARLVKDLLREGLLVIKGLYLKGEPSVRTASLYGASACLVECSAGPLPGGNAMLWDWGAAAGSLPSDQLLIVAGGLTPDNVRHAIESSSPDGVDVSSGVESLPGRKDLQKVKRFMGAVLGSRCSRSPRVVFH